MGADKDRPNRIRQDGFVKDDRSFNWTEAQEIALWYRRLFYRGKSNHPVPLGLNGDRQCRICDQIKDKIVFFNFDKHNTQDPLGHNYQWSKEAVQYYEGVFVEKEGKSLEKEGKSLDK